MKTSLFFAMFSDVFLVFFSLEFKNKKKNTKTLFFTRIES